MSRGWCANGLRACGRSRSLPRASGSPTRRTRTRDRGRGRRRPGCSSMRSSTTRPCRRKRRIHSPWGSTKSTESPSVTRFMPNAVRCKRRRHDPVVVEAHDSERRRVAEDEPAARSQHACDLGHAVVRIGERHRPVIAEDDVERRARERHVPPRSPARTAHGVPLLAAWLSCAADRSRPTTRTPSRGQRDRPLPTTAAELEHVEPGEVTQRTDL